MPAIRANSVLPAEPKPVTLHTADGHALVGEVAVPQGRHPVATLVCLHPLPRTWDAPMDTADSSAYADRTSAVFADRPVSGPEET
jgi:hypothetical protein